MTNEEILETIRELQTRLSTVESAAATKVLCKNEDSQAVLKIVEGVSHITIPRKLANTLLGILESEYEGTNMFQDEIKELKELL